MEKNVDKKQESKRGGFSKSLKTIAVVLIAFAIGNAVGSGQVPFGSQRSEYQAATGLPEKLDYSQVDDVYEALRSNYNGKLTEQQVLDGIKQGIAQSTNDPYTEFYTAEEAKEFQSQIDNSFSGIGAELGKDDEDNLIVVSPISGFPAEKAGLRAQDIIAQIDGESSRNLSIDQAVKRIRGEQGTSVTLTIIRNRSNSQELTITRENIQIPSVEHEVLEGNIGYIQLKTFSSDSGQLVREAANEFKQKNVKGVVLDMRGNPGGRLEQAVEVSSVWLPRGKTVLEEKRGDVTIKKYESSDPTILQGMPTVVLIDEGSASASEIVAGALKDNNAARLVGTKSYGKGVVQQTVCVSAPRGFDGSCAGDMLKVTVASWHRPNGKNIHKEGIKPDQEVKLSEEDIKAQDDKQRQAAIDYLNR